ncbi:transporter substrate-binding domain-containing protein [Duganella fentianensis]|uniref:transporter substrate-binding domain-containing protein n=1 Tax=Duganella fentianensis TaxID=2692177 RepID=UPI0032B2933E
MSCLTHPVRYLRGGLPAVLLVAGMAHAACSRPIVAPVAPTGYSVIVKDNQVSGAFPDALRELGKQYGCEFVFPVMPRARSTYMFLNSGESDLLLPASRSEERDRQAEFIPMMKLRMALISNKQGPVRSTSVADLLAHPEWRGAVVRSYVFGNEYNSLIDKLDAQHRISYVAAPLMVARMMKVGRVDFTVVAPTIFFSSLSEDASLASFAREVQVTPLDGLPPADSGIYLSQKSLTAADRDTLRQLLRQAARGMLWKWFQHYYPPEIAAYAVRPH